MRLTVALLLVASVVSAQSLPKPQRQPPEPLAHEAIAPPKLISESPAPYPAGASGAARVVLLVYLDGEPIPLLYHFGAISSTFNPDLLEAIDYIPGNFSTRYGDLIGGLVDVRQRKLREEPATAAFRSPKVRSRDCSR